MTPADIAKHSAISFEAKKDSLRQMQNGDWKVAFTIQGVDMDERITRAAMGTRFIAVLVEIDEQELPVHQPAKEKNSPSPKLDPATPSLSLDKPAEKAKREKMDWRELQPAAQSAIRCNDPVFIEFLKEQYEPCWIICKDAADVVRSICGVKSRADLGTKHAARMIWRNLDDQYLAWKAMEHA